MFDIHTTSFVNTSAESFFCIGSESFSVENKGLSFSACKISTSTSISVNSRTILDEEGREMRRLRVCFSTESNKFAIQNSIFQVNKKNFWSYNF